MLGWSDTAAAKFGVAFASVVVVSVMSFSAHAQYINNVCGTTQGTCIVNPAPIGSECGCMTNFGAIPGAVLPPGGGYMPQQMQAISNACRTYRGICQTYPAPIGSSCGCYGDPGTVIPR
jgi:hypothetical protein